jgi:HlyD family secretion protein
VDETDIVNVHLGQPAEIAIDAIPKKTFHGIVSEIGDNAIVRSSGVSTSQQATASEEAKDFKVVVTLNDPPKDLRPGLSTTAKITTATRTNVLAMPIQALTLRTKQQIDAQNNPAGSVHAAAPASATPAKTKKEDDQQGVFVIRNKKAFFVPVTTGITGTTDIEVMDGLKEGDEVITGSYKILRSLKPGSGVKIDNTVPKKEDESS